MCYMIKIWHKISHFFISRTNYGAFDKMKYADSKYGTQKVEF
jgi:hypothetical protein